MWSFELAVLLPTCLVLYSSLSLPLSWGVRSKCVITFLIQDSVSMPGAFSLLSEHLLMQLGAISQYLLSRCQIRIENIFWLLSLLLKWWNQNSVCFEDSENDISMICYMLFPICHMYSSLWKCVDDGSVWHWHHLVHFHCIQYCNGVNAFFFQVIINPVCVQE